MASAQRDDAIWKGLYRVGGVAPLITIAFYLTEALSLLSGEPFPASTEDWFRLFQRSKIMGLLYLNALDILSIALLGVMFLALVIALWRGHESALLIAGFLAVVGVVVFIVPRVATLAVLPLSEQYAAAASAAQRSEIIAAGRALAAQGAATPMTAGFFFLSAATLILSVVMLRTPIFGRLTAYAGVAASGLTIVGHLSSLIAPVLVGPLLGLLGILWIGWWGLISRGLLRLARLTEEKREQTE